MNFLVSLVLLLVGVVWLGMLVWSAVEILGAPEVVPDDAEVELPGPDR